MARITSRYGKKSELDASLLLTTLATFQRGDFSARMPSDWAGVPGKIADTLNEIIDMAERTTDDFMRVSQVVGKAGRVNVPLLSPDMHGSWAKLVDSRNTLIEDLVTPLNEIVRIISAISNGDLSQSMPMEINGKKLEGQFLKSAEMVNTMVDQLFTISSEVTRVAREVGMDGKLGGQANVPGVSGTWKDLTDSVNFMATNLTVQLRDVSKVATAIAQGDLGQKITVDVKGEILQIKDVINTMVDQLSTFSSEVTRVAREVGMDGRLGGQANVPGVSGTWKDLTDNVNSMATNLTVQVRGIAKVVTAVANGDLGKKVTVDVKGEIADLAGTINSMTETLALFADQVTRVAREVGMDGRLGGQANVPGVSGTWKDLTDNVNSMATNLTDQVRGIAKVVTAVANGDLGKKVTVDVKGEIADLAGTINSMTETLALFADQVTRVAREVGMDGRLGGQANVPGVSGTWKDLTDNVNSMATNLTDQVRAIAGVATAVTKGDLTRSVKVEAKGEVAELKDNVNEMIRNLRETTNQNSEQDWLKTNLAKFTRILQGQRDPITVSKVVLSELAPLVDAHYGAFYIMGESPSGETRLKMLSAYAYKERKNLAKEWKIGEGLVGQCAFEKQRILLADVPSDYVQITSGLGQAKPLNIVVLPIIFEGKVKAVIELASFKQFSGTHQTFLDQLAESIGIVLNIIEADMRTDELLKQSQSLTNELQSQQEELRQTNDELEEKALLLEEQKMEVEAKNYEVSQAKAAVEEKASQLALTSRYKSEFLSNMSHELRTPLNSLLILAEQLANNPQNHLDSKEVEFAKLIEVSGNDLLLLINEILDLSKIESGTVSLNLSAVPFAAVHDQIENTFHHVAKDRGLGFEIMFAPDLPLVVIADEMRLLQVMKNLLSNSLKFTEKGQVTVRVDRAVAGWSPENEYLNNANEVFAFTVEDTGIGISADKQRIIFEAFQQGDGSTARKYGGTGLGLSISREIARLLGGELKLVRSASQQGSTFVFYLPQGDINEAISVPTQESGQRPSSGRQSNLRGQSSAMKSDILNQTLQATMGSLDGKKVLIVDDDARNIFALSAALERKGVIVSSVENGHAALEFLKKTPEVDIVLMDIMMPEMDGYETMREIRKVAKFKKLPIIALTAKAMVGDREKCIEAGASDYLSKPVNIKQLTSLMQAWLSR